MATIPNLFQSKQLKIAVDGHSLPMIKYRGEVKKTPKELLSFDELADSYSDQENEIPHSDQQSFSQHNKEHNKERDFRKRK